MPARASSPAGCAMRRRVPRAACRPTAPTPVRWPSARWRRPIRPWRNWSATSPLRRWRARFWHAAAAAARRHRHLGRGAGRLHRRGAAACRRALPGRRGPARLGGAHAPNRRPTARPRQPGWSCWPRPIRPRAAAPGRTAWRCCARRTPVASIWLAHRSDGRGSLRRVRAAFARGPAAKRRSSGATASGRRCQALPEPAARFMASAARRPVAGACARCRPAPNSPSTAGCCRPCKTAGCAAVEIHTPVTQASASQGNVALPLSLTRGGGLGAARPWGRS